MRDDRDKGEARTLALASLNLSPADPLLALIEAVRSDPRPEKIDLGVGVYCDEHGRTPVMRAVKEAERRLWHSQNSKAYVSAEGDGAFVDALRMKLLGLAERGPATVGIQTAGGTAALRIALELVRAANPNARVVLGRPGWVNYDAIIAAVGLPMVSYRHFDRTTQMLCFDELMAALGQAEAGDVVLLQADCHNPTGVDFDDEQWQSIACAVNRRGLLPLIDIAYFGLGRNTDVDSRALNAFLAELPEALLAVSCSKTFGLYRERTGALYVRTGSAYAKSAKSQMLAIARALYSMPPDHGSAVVRTILTDDDLTVDWLAELTAMRQRIRGVRADLAALAKIGDVDLSTIASQRGMFSLPAMSSRTVAALRARAVYVPDSGRMNIAALRPSSIASLGQVLETIA